MNREPHFDENEVLRQCMSPLNEEVPDMPENFHAQWTALARSLADEGRYREALQTVDGLNITALTAGDATPGWEHRLRALRGRILVLSGDGDGGRALLAASVPALAALGTEEDAELRQLEALLAGGAGAGR